MNKREKRQHVSKRLDELMAADGRSNRQVALTMNNLFDRNSEKYASSIISRVRTGKSALPDHYIEPLSRVLKIEPGYLAGDDDFQAHSYNEYLSLMGKEDQIKKYSPDLQRKATILNMAGYSVNFNFNTPSTKDADARPFNIYVGNSKKSGVIPYSTMEKIEETVVQVATALVDLAIEGDTSMSMTMEEFAEIKQNVVK